MALARYWHSNETHGARYVGPDIWSSRKSIFTGFAYADHGAAFSEDTIDLEESYGRIKSINAITWVKFCALTGWHIALL